MKFSLKWLGGAQLAFLGVLLGGCLPGGLSQTDEQREPHFLAGKNHSSAMDYPAAVSSYEQALEVNPKSASAHFELGWLFDQKIQEPAEAIYHYNQYLKLRPGAGDGETVRTRIMACKQALAQTVSLGPVTQTLQREFDKLAEKNKKLEEEASEWQSRYYSLMKQMPTNPPLVAAQSARPAPLVGAGETVTPVVNRSQTGSATRPSSSPASAPTPPATMRSHTVKSGETPSLIARQYGVKVEALMAANPRLDARRMRPGQPLNVPVH
jgi:LysM repeat protein